VLGTHLLCDQSGNGLQRETLRRKMADGFAGAYENRLVWETADSSLYATVYSTYPSRVVEDPVFMIHLEGYLYHIDETALDAELTRLARILFASDGQVAQPLEQWLLSADGDFLIVVRHKQTGEVAVVNDILGRLPAYYSIHRGRLVLSRDLRLVAWLAQETTMDLMAIAQYLLLGFTLGARTWFEHVHTLQPATVVKARPDKLSWEVMPVHDFNLDGTEHAGKGHGENARQLAVRFREACRNRSRWCGGPVVSLSGGLDSRAVAAGFWKEGIPFATATFLDHRYSNQLDFDIAREVALVLGVEWHGCRLSAPRGDDLTQLLALKHGLNNLRMSCLLPFFRSLRERFGTNILYLTGDGGGDTLGDSTPYRNTPTLDSLIDYLIERYQVFSVADVAALTRVDPDELKMELVRLLASYPEVSLAAKYKHFFCLEVALRMYHQGEDRNRHYFWSSTPFYAIDFFAYALNCSDASKRGYRLYRDFLAELHPDLHKIPYANWNASVQSTRFKALYTIKNLTRAWPGVIRRLRRLTGRHDTVGPATNVLGCLTDQIDKCPDLEHFLDLRMLRRLLQNARAYDRIQLWTLYTLTSVIDDWTNPRPVLANYLDREFE
jgi:asparagine synthase (glutamine-hydrolysing)